MTPSDVQAVDQLLAEPENPAVDAFAHNQYLHPESFDHTKQQYLDAQARKYGQTIVDGNGLSTQLAREEKTKPFSYFLRKTNDFTKKLGFDVSVGKPGNINFDSSSQPPTTAQLAKPATKDILAGLILDYSNIPRQYIRLSSLKHVILAYGTQKSDEAGYVEPIWPHDTYVININDGFTSDNNLHEDGHLLDASCGYLASDPQFVKLNKGKLIYSHNQQHPYDDKDISYTDYYVPVDGRIASRESIDQAAGDSKAYCSDVATETDLAHKVLTWSDYHPNDREDKAEIYSVLPNGQEWDVLDDSRFTVLHAKFKLLLERLYASAPKLVQYLAATSLRPTIDRYAQKHC